MEPLARKAANSCFVARLQLLFFRSQPFSDVAFNLATPMQILSTFAAFLREMAGCPRAPGRFWGVAASHVAGGQGGHRLGQNDTGLSGVAVAMAITWGVRYGYRTVTVCNRSLRNRSAQKCTEKQLRRERLRRERLRPFLYNKNK